MRALAQADDRQAIDVGRGERQARQVGHVGDEMDLDQRLRHDVEYAPGVVVATHRQGNEYVRDLVFQDERGQIGGGAGDVQGAGPAIWLVLDEAEGLYAPPADVAQ